MYFRLVVTVLAVVGSAWESACEKEEREVFLESLRELSQEEAELILNAETTLRSYFMLTLANLGERIFGATSFYPAVEEILQGLRSRDLNPLKSLENGYSVDGHRSTALQLATLIHSLQRCSVQELTFSDWHSFLQTMPNLETVVPPPPDIHVLPHHLHKVNSRGTPFVLFVLLAVHHNHLTPTPTLLRHVLYNYRYRNYSPDLDAIAQSLSIGQSLLKTDPSANGPDEMLSGLLKSLPSQEDSVLAFQTTVLLSALSSNENTAQTRIRLPWELFSLIGSDDYPPDIVQAATELSAVVKNQQVNINLTTLWGYSPLEQLLSVVTQLTTVRSANNISVKVHALYPHVKLKFLSHKQKFFRPRTSSDVAFLLNSFLTTPSATVIREVHKIFLLPQFNWQNILKGFDYSKHSKPRSLFLDLLQELLRRSDKLPTCAVIAFSIFLRKNIGAPNCLSHEINSDIINDQVTPILPYSQPTIRCPDGLPVELIDAGSVVEVMKASDCAAFIAGLIKNEPMPVSKYPQFTRQSVYDAFLSNLETTSNNASTRLAIQLALNQVLLNDKADLPPKYFRLCPSQVIAMAVKARAQQLSLCHQSAGHPQEIFTAENGTGLSLDTFEVFIYKTSHADNLTKKFLIPVKFKVNYSKAREVEELLDHLSGATTDRKLLGHIDKVKYHARAIQQATVVTACLRNPRGCTCRKNESSVAIVNTNTLVPCTLCPHRVIDRFKFFFIVIDTSEKVTKRTVLLEILSHLEQSEEAYMREEIKELQGIILSSENSEEVNVLNVCMPNALIKDLHQQALEIPLAINTDSKNSGVLAPQHFFITSEPATTESSPSPSQTTLNPSPLHSSFSPFSRSLITVTETDSTFDRRSHLTPLPALQQPMSQLTSTPSSAHTTFKETRTSAYLASSTTPTITTPFALSEVNNMLTANASSALTDTFTSSITDDVSTDTPIDIYSPKAMPSSFVSTATSPLNLSSVSTEPFNFHSLNITRSVTGISASSSSTTTVSLAPEELKHRHL